jgi:hypothetical protein
MSVALTMDVVLPVLAVEDAASASAATTSNPIGEPATSF